MKTKKFSFIFVLAAFVIALSAAFAATCSLNAKADGDVSAAVTLGKGRWTSYLDTANPQTSRIDAAFDNNSWDSAFATTENVTYGGKAETVKGEKINVDVTIGKATDGKFRIDFKLPQTEDCKFIVAKSAVFTTASDTAGLPKSISFDTSYVITYKVGAAPSSELLGILTPTNMKWSQANTEYAGYVGYCAFEYTSEGYNPKDENVEMKGITIHVYDLEGNQTNGRMDVNFSKSGRVYIRVASDTLTQFVVKKGEVFALSGKAFKFDDTYKFTWVKDGGTTACEKFDESLFDKSDEPIAEKLVVAIGGGIWASPLDNGATTQLSFNSTKKGNHTATGTYVGKAEDADGNEVDLSISWDAGNANKLVMRFSSTVETIVLKTSMEFNIKEEIAGAPNKVSFEKDVYIVYAIGTSSITVGDLSQLANMKTAELSLGACAYATDSNPEQAEARVFVSFIYCFWNGDFTLPQSDQMGKGIRYGGKVYDKDGNEYTQSVEIEITLMPEKDRTEESEAGKQFRVYVKFAKTVNPVFLKAGTVFQRIAEIDGTPFKLVIDKDYIVTYELDSDIVKFTPHLVTFAASDEIYVGASLYVENEGKIKAPEDAKIPDGYRAEWVDANGAAFDFENDKVTSDLTLSLRLVKQVTVTFDSDGGTKINPRTVDVNGKIAKPNDPLKLSDDEKKAYVLEGWYLGDEAFDFENATITEDITLKAKWTLKTVKASVTFNSDGGTEIPSQLVDINGKATVPAAPQKTVDGKTYVFDGWYAEGQNKPFDFENTAITEDITLTAKWSEKGEGGCQSSVGLYGSLSVSLLLVGVAAIVLLRRRKPE